LEAVLLLHSSALLERAMPIHVFQLYSSHHA